MKKLMMKMIIGERAKRARHSQVCSIENRGYIYIQWNLFYPDGLGLRGVRN